MILFQKDKFSDDDIKEFYSNLKLNDFVFDFKKQKISYITELFGNQCPQIDNEKYCDVHPICITQDILSILGFEFVSKEIVNNNNMLFYKFNIKSVYNINVGICLYKDNTFLIGIYNYVDNDKRNFNFLPINNVKYLNEIQHIMIDTFGFNFKANFEDYKSSILNVIKSDWKKIENELLNT